MHQWVYFINRWLKRGLPGYCSFCLAQALAGRGWCATCLCELPWNLHACRQCADPVAHGASLCAHCLIEPPAFSTTQAGLLYQGPIKQLVHDFKFYASPRAGTLLAELMLLTPPVTQGDALLSVPMTTRHARTRGFNQSHWLAEQLSRQLGVPMVTAKRVKDSPSQRTLNRRQRATNLAGAFVFESLPPAHITIIDEVVTTGSTGHALATAPPVSG
ncbi:ComF family protein [Vreelandella profundi]|uniref:ComF family protein n=1 Tax=Vreelandella profundi TaxID=2852117 RepID=UPI001F2B9955|nr:ComF family protein [Halomonas profundi]